MRDSEQQPHISIQLDKIDHEARAIIGLTSALKNLDAETCQRILAWANARYGR